MVCFCNMKRRWWVAAGVVLLLLLYLGSFAFSYGLAFKHKDSLLMTDVARLVPVRVSSVRSATTVEELQAILEEAKERGLKVSIAGQRHSQGGHTYYPDAVVVDMRSFNRVLELDPESKIIRVQSGTRWKDVQAAANEHGLAVKVMQSSYIFTIGGTLSANAHGRDLDLTDVVETVESFRLLMADGTIKNVSRSENAELFKLVIGGYGLFGIILDVDIALTDDAVYEQKSAIVDYAAFPAYFAREVEGNPDVRMMLGRPSIDSSSFLREMVVTTWNATTTEPEGVHILGEEKNVLRDKFFFGLSRKFDWAKDLRWCLQKKVEAGVGDVRLVSRNNSMRPPLAPLELLDYYSPNDTDIIQEYYVPTRNFVPFMDEFRSILIESDMNVISSTVRYVKANDETYLSYAPDEDAFAIIHMSNVGLSKEGQVKAEATTRRLVDAALKYDGTYYLTYQSYPSEEQFLAAYPKAPHVFAQKKAYDPGELFMNEFYKTYAH